MKDISRISIIESILKIKLTLEENKNIEKETIELFNKVMTKNLTARQIQKLLSDFLEMNTIDILN